LTTQPDRQLRADARKNYDALLTVALRHLAQHGTKTSLEAIAKDAGVGKGTLYRHFPTRDTLLAAALQAKDRELRKIHEEISLRDDAGDALREWLKVLQCHLTVYDGLPDPLIRALSDDSDVPLAISCRELTDMTRTVLCRAQEAGQARPGLSAETLFVSALMTGWATSRVDLDAKSREELRALIEKGYAP
jgi:AcrR family transcriptional regulator